MVDCHYNQKLSPKGSIIVWEIEYIFAHDTSAERLI